MSFFPIFYSFIGKEYNSIDLQLPIPGMKQGFQGQHVHWQLTLGAEIQGKTTGHSQSNILIATLSADTGGNSLLCETNITDSSASVI